MQVIEINKNISLFTNFLINVVIALLLIGCKEKPIDLSTRKEIISVISQWDKAHSDRTIRPLFNLYYERLNYYGVEQNKLACIENKLFKFSNSSGFLNQTSENFEFLTLEEDIVKCSFMKETTNENYAKSVKTYLVFKRIEGKWKIISESDLVNDLMGENDWDLNSRVRLTKLISDDSKNEVYVWLEKPRIDDSYNNCVGDCSCILNFSNKKSNNVVIDNCIGGNLENLGDLNNDGRDEIGLLPDWFTSCWKRYLVWTSDKNNQWKPLVKPISVHCFQLDGDIKPIRKDPSDNRKIILSHSERDERGNFIVVTDTIIARTL